MLFVVATHLWREAGNIVPPACQNLADDGINTLAHNEMIKSTLADQRS
jgi:hypothetical protein